MGEQSTDAAALADDLARKTAAAVHADTKITTAGLNFDDEPQTFLAVLEELADDSE